MNPLLIEEIIQLSIVALHGIIAMNTARHEKKPFGQVIQSGILSSASALPTVLQMTGGLKR